MILGKILRTCKEMNFFFFFLREFIFANLRPLCEICENFCHEYVISPHWPKYHEEIMNRNSKMLNLKFCTWRFFEKSVIFRGTFFYSKLFINFLISIFDSFNERTWFWRTVHRPLVSHTWQEYFPYFRACLWYSKDTNCMLQRVLRS